MTRGCLLAVATTAALLVTLGAPGARVAAQEGERGTPAQSTPRVTVTTLVENGGRLDWSARNNLIVFDRRIGNGYFDIYTMTPDGRNERCLTCGKKDLPKKSKGNPAWHPSGEFIIFQAQNNYAGLGRIGLGRITDYFANPGAGINNDIWVMDKEGRRFWQLTTVKPRVGGVLHPQFSRDGTKVFWAERISLNGPWGEWALKSAEFKAGSNDVRLADVRLDQPGAQRRMYESHGFSPDGDEVIFSGNLEKGQAETAGDIYLFNLKTGQLRNLTRTPNEWDEHAHFSPDGRTIVWMTNKDLAAYSTPQKLRTDYWLMDADGGNKRRLTYFNTPGHPEFLTTGATAADSAWSPDGTRIAAYLITDVSKGGKIVMIDLK